MALSSTGKNKLCAYAVIIALDITILALSVSVNVFQGFFFVADLFPLALSIATLAILVLQTALDLTSQNAFTARPAFEIPLLGTLAIVWLGFNSFSTLRWAGLPNCSVFNDLPDERAWCRNMQGLRVIVWIEWAALSLTTLALVRVSIVQTRRGNTAVWHTALSRYHPEKQPEDVVLDTSSFYRGSSIFGFDKNCHQKGLSMASRDWFAPAEPVIRLGDNAEGKRDSYGGSFFGAGVGAYGTRLQLAVPLQQQIQAPRPTKDPTTAKTTDGFEIVSMGYYQDHWGGGPQYR